MVVALVNYLIDCAAISLAKLLKGFGLWSLGGIATKQQEATDSSVQISCSAFQKFGYIILASNLAIH